MAQLSTEASTSTETSFSRLGHRVILTETEIREIRELLGELNRKYPSVEDPAFHHRAALYAHELPLRVREELIDFKTNEPPSALLVVSGYPIDDAKVGPTPSHWESERDGGQAREEIMLLVLLGSLLGDCLGWATQQDSRLVHDILPIKGNEGEQLGTGSEQLLWWHVEDAFHPYRGDYLGMLCLRNPDRIATTFTAISEIELDPRHRELLFQPSYKIRPDESHLMKNKAAARDIDPELAAAYERIEKINSEREKIAILSGDPSSPYVRIDPYFMDRVEDNPEAQEAFETLVTAIDNHLHDLVLEAGDFCFIDNYQGVHGRKPFKARYDGTDRWLKRINITRDLRKSRTSRRNASSRIIL